MKQIQLTQGKVALVDDRDYLYLSQFNWYATKSRNTWYAQRSTTRVGGHRHTLKMHQEIKKAPLGSKVDHEDHDGLNNQRYNLRVSNSAQNAWNRGPQKGKTFKGVTKERSRFKARILVQGTRLSLGYHDTEEQAARAYDVAAMEHHGEFACLNFPLKEAA